MKKWLKNMAHSFAKILDDIALIVEALVLITSILLCVLKIVL